MNDVTLIPLLACQEGNGYLRFLAVHQKYCFSSTSTSQEVQSASCASFHPRQIPLFQLAVTPNHRSLPSMAILSWAARQNASSEQIITHEV